MITNITLENFKCFRHISVEPKLITLFIGPNGTGKSGVMQALLLLKQSRTNVVRLTFTGELIRYAPDAFMFLEGETSSDAVRISMSANSSIEIDKSHWPITFIVDLKYSRQADLLEDNSSTRWVNSGDQFAIHFDRPGKRLEAVTPRGAIGYEVLSQINGFNVRYGSGGEDPSIPLWERLSKVPVETVAEIKMVPAARGLTRDVYSLGSTLFEDISGASGLGTQEDDTVTTLAYSGKKVEKVSGLMKQITDVGFRVETVPPQSAKPVSESLAGDLSLIAEGFGTNALVHLLFEVGRTKSGATVLIEEPEIHLHPGAQADLASVLVEEAVSENKQIMMTTHSEHVAGRLLTLVAEGKLSADDLAIYSFEKDETGVCSASEIEVTDRGQVTGGLKSFFETDLDEMRRYVEALRAKA